MHAPGSENSHVERDRIGAAPRRKEDFRFLTGRGNYVADIKRADMAFGVFIRSPHGHASIRGIDKAPALALPVSRCADRGRCRDRRPRFAACGWAFMAWMACR